MAKFLGCYEEYKRLLKTYGIKWSGKSADDLVIERLIRTTDPDQVWTWVKEVKQKIPSLSTFMDFISITGLRLEEAVNSWNLIVALSKEGGLNTYYNADWECLEHFRFRQFFIRRTKKAFISFLPKEIVDSMSLLQPFKSKFSVIQKLRLKGIRQRFSDIREAHNSILVRHLSQSEIDFLAGRTSASVFMANYFNPKLVDDLKHRVFQAIIDILQRINPNTTNPTTEYNRNLEIGVRILYN